MSSRIQSTQHGSFELPISAPEAFPLFSAEGERSWIAGWNPTAIYPCGDKIPFATNAVWQTMHGNESSKWWTIEADHQKHRADYVYITDSRAIRVTVSVRELSTNSCLVEVSYVNTSLTAGGDSYVQAANEDSMRRKMEDWKRMIEASLVH